MATNVTYTSLFSDVLYMPMRTGEAFSGATPALTSRLEGKAEWLARDYLKFASGVVRFLDDGTAREIFVALSAKCFSLPSQQSMDAGNMKDERSRLGTGRSPRGFEKAENSGEAQCSPIAFAGKLLRDKFQQAWCWITEFVATNRASTQIIWSNALQQSTWLNQIADHQSKGCEHTVSVGIHIQATTFIFAKKVAVYAKRALIGVGDRAIFSTKEILIQRAIAKKRHAIMDIHCRKKTFTFHQTENTKHAEYAEKKPCNDFGCAEKWKE